jgi:hypothetical protein
MKIQAFDWVYNTCRLLNGEIVAADQQMLNLNYWRQHFDLHSVLTQILPLIDKHPILQRI